MSQHQIIDPSHRLTGRVTVLAAGALVSASFLALALFGGASARAETSQAKAKSQVRSCQATFQNGQDREKSGRLVEASQLFASCSDEACGTAIWHDCVASSTRLHASLPSIVPVALDDAGDPRADVEVTMDGRVIASQLTGRSIPVDPGQHEFSFSTGAGVFASAKITVVEGERNRTLSVSCPAAPRGERSTTAAK